MTVTGVGTSPRWVELAREVGGVIGRSRRPVCFILGAGCSLSSGAPTTAAVHHALSDATRARFAGLDLRQAMHTLPRAEIQDILLPLFRDVSFGVGYLALASLARRFKVLVINMNWDKALAQACERARIRHTILDIDQLLDNPPDPGIAGLIDLHVHGIIGEDCRYGILETLSFTEGQRAWLLANGLANTTLILGATLTYETDFSQLFDEQSRRQTDRRAAASQWFFVRAPEAESPEDRLRQYNANAQGFTYVQHEEVDFDTVITLVVDRALSIVSNR